MVLHLRSTFGAVPDFSRGWGYAIRQGSNKARSIRIATALLSLLAKRFRYVQIEHQDFATIIQTYQTPRMLLYADPPYVHCEGYYNEHPLVSDLYPASLWRRISWMQAKAVEKTRDSRQYGHEVLLMNYPEALGLWQDAQ